MTECFLRSVDQLFQALSTDCPEYQLTGGRGGRGGRGCPHSIDQLTLRTESGNDIIKNLEDPDMYTSVTSHRLQVVIDKVSKLVESKKQILSAGYEDAWNVNGDNARDHEGVAMLEQLSKMKKRLEDGGKEFVLALEGVEGYDSTGALLRGTRLARELGADLKHERRIQGRKQTESAAFHKSCYINHVNGQPEPARTHAGYSEIGRVLLRYLGR